MKKLYRWNIALLAVFILSFSALGNAKAAPSTSPTGSVGGNGYKVWPVRTNPDLVIAPGTSKTTIVNVQNVSSGVESVQVFINDLQPRSDESGMPALLLNGEQAPQHGLKQYATVTPSTFTLQPQKSEAVTVKVTMPTTAIGGYYGAVRFATTGAPGDKSVNLAASIASLVLVRVPGTTKDQLSITSFDVRQDDSAHTIFTSGKRLQAVVRFHNTGNVQEEPFGKIILKKGKTELSTQEVNNVDPRGNVLPDSIRRFSVPLNKVSSFGKYTIEGNFGYSSKGQLLSAKTTFYVVPLAAMITIVALLILLLLAIFALPRLIRSYNQRVLRRAGRR